MSKEHTEAANALIGWFNSQDLSKTDAKLVMAKVMAKLLVDETTDMVRLSELLDRHHAELFVEISARARHIITNRLKR